MLVRPDGNLARWDELNRKRPVVGIAGNDAHQNVNLLGFQIDPYDVSLGFVTTHVQAEELTEESVLAALKAGRAYVAFEFVAAAPAPADEPRGEARRVTIPERGVERVEYTRDGKPWLYFNPR
jgi:hypothetical protein